MGVDIRSKILSRLDRVAARATRTTFSSRSHDVLDMAFFKAGLEAAEFYESELIGATSFADHASMLDRALNLADPNGLFMEFGVATGRTITQIANHHSGLVFGFDSFEGLPEDWYPGYSKGSFARVDLPSVPENVELVKGWFSETLGDWLDSHPGPVSFLHVDCDLYSSSKVVLDGLADRLRSGTVVQFDEFFNYPGWREHEYRAWSELVAAHGIEFRYDSFLRSGQAVCAIVE